MEFYKPNFASLSFCINIIDGEIIEQREIIKIKEGWVFKEAKEWKHKR